MPDLITLAIPVFFVLMAVEWVAARVLEQPTYRLADTINDLSCGILDQVLEVFAKTTLFTGYLYLHTHHRLAEIPISSSLAWAACFVGVDFLYYWFHRLSHEVNFLWAAHVVHHQSEEYNLAVALRQGALQSWYSWAFYLPLAVIGFPPAMFLTITSLDTLYQFWIHTRMIRRMGPFEWVFNTPSHHRVHHGRNPKYIDRNHGGTLIVWDRLFGTFQVEEEEPAYGVTRPLANFNPLWANAQYWVEMTSKAARAASFADKVRMFLKPPGWNPPELGGFMAAPDVDPAHVKHDTAVAPGLRAYVSVQFLLALSGTSAYLFGQGALDPVARAACGIAVVLTLTALGGLLDGHRWAFALEALRLALLAASAVAFAAAGHLAVALPAGIVALFAGPWLALHRAPASADA